MLVNIIAYLCSFLSKQFIRIPHRPDFYSYSHESKKTRLFEIDYFIHVQVGLMGGSGDVYIDITFPC